jgi:hypothetical protein
VIPKKIHFVWSGRSFPYPFSLAIRSAWLHHPDWEIVLHVGVEPESQWWEQVKGLGNIRREDPETLLASVPEFGRRLVDLHRAVPADYPAGKSNLVRLAILLSEGGWYLDCDTLCLRPLSDVSVQGSVVGEEWVWAHDQERVTSGFRARMIPSVIAFALSWTAARLGITDPAGGVEEVLRKLWGRLELNNAVLACEPGDPWILRLLELALEQNPRTRFALGPGLVNLGWNRPGSAPLPLRTPPAIFYQFPPSQTIRYFRGVRGEIPPNAAVLHWCSSNHRELVREMTPDLVERHADRGPWFREAMRCRGGSSS